LPATGKRQLPTGLYASVARAAIADQLRLDELDAFAKVPKPFEQQVSGRAPSLFLGRRILSERR
jgi:hypothetical protein